MTKNAIGLRANPNAIFYSIISEDDKTYTLQITDKLILPEALQVPERLKYIRNTFIDILSEFEVSSACIRITESTAQTVNITRVSIEAVVQELFASSPIKAYFTGQISNISAKLGFERENFKALVAGTSIFKEIDDWSAYKPESREAILAAFAALTLI